MRGKDRRGRKTRNRRWALLLTGILAAGGGWVAYREFDVPLPDTSRLEVAEIIDNPVRTAEVGISLGSEPMEYSDAEITRQFDLAASAGVGWVRIDLDWSKIEATRGSLDWAFVDRAVGLAAERDIRVLGILAYTPEWARPEGTTDKHPPDGDDGFANLAAAAVRRYGPDSPRSDLRNTITHWEIWNEPNIRGFWEGGADPERYATLFNAAATTLRAADPSATILVGGLAPADDEGNDLSGPTFLRRFFQAGGDGSLFDAVGVHPYTFPALPGENQTWNSWFRITEVISVLRQFNAATGVEIWVTEFGAPTGGRNSISLEQHEQMVRSALACAATSSRFGPVFIYSLVDLNSRGSDREDHFGLITSDGKAKPAWDTLKEITGGEGPTPRCGP